MKKLTWLVVFTSHILFCSDTERLSDSDGLYDDLEFPVAERIEGQHAQQNYFEWDEDNFIFEYIDSFAPSKLDEYLETIDEQNKKNVINKAYPIYRTNEKTILLTPLEFAISQYSSSTELLEKITTILKKHGLDTYKTITDKYSCLKLALAPLNLYETYPNYKTIKYLIEDLNQMVNENEDGKPLDYFLSYIQNENFVLSDLQIIEIFTYLTHKGAESDYFENSIKEIEEDLAEKLKSIYYSYYASETRALWNDHNKIK